jgi:hypothetical protein
MILKKCLEIFAMGAVILFSIIGVAYVISTFFSNIILLSCIQFHIYNAAFAIFGLMLTCLHYAFIIICMTSTLKLEWIGSIFLTHFKVYHYIKNFSKQTKLFFIFTHFFHILYLSQFLTVYYDRKDNEIFSDF